MRIDWERVARAPSLAVSLPTLPPDAGVQGVPQDTLPALEAPPAPQTVRARRQLALQSIQTQREGVREQMLATRLSTLPELEARWRAELQASLDFAAVWQAWDQRWYEAFQQYGQRRYYPLVRMNFAEVGSEAYRHAQAELNLLNWLWSLQEQNLRAELQEQLARLNQEVEVRLRARRREFIQQAEAEVESLLATQPDWQSLYLPTPTPLPSLPPQLESLPAPEVKIPPQNLNTGHEERVRQTESIRLALLRQLAEEWARKEGYRLTNDPTAPDYTDAFLAYQDLRSSRR